MYGGLYYIYLCISRVMPGVTIATKMPGHA